MINSVNRALEVLLYLAENKEIGVRELARIFDVNEATAFRLLSTLEKYNFVCQDSLTKKYRLGLETVKIGFSCLNNFDIVKIAKPYLEELNIKTCETVCLMIKQGECGVYLDKNDSGHAVRVHAEIGASIPLYKGAAAKSIAAFLPHEEQQQLLDKYESSVVADGFDKNNLIREYREIKEQGYAVSDEEIDLGVLAVGCPIFSYKGDVIASIGIPMPKARASQDHLHEVIKDLKKTCAQISKELGYKLLNINN